MPTGGKRPDGRSRHNARARSKAPSFSSTCFRRARIAASATLAILKAPTDLLVEPKVIEADDNTIVRAVALGWSKAVTGARVQIIPFPKT